LLTDVVLAVGRAFALKFDEFQCSEASCHSCGWKSRQQRSPVAVVVISGGGKGDRPAESPEVKVPDGWETGRIRAGGRAN
jgi:hypothetical protein